MFQRKAPSPPQSSLEPKPPIPECKTSSPPIELQPLRLPVKNLPVDLTENVFSFLDGSTLVNVTQSCRFFLDQYKQCDAPSLWQSIVKKELSLNPRLKPDESYKNYFQRAILIKQECLALISTLPKPTIVEPTALTSAQLLELTESKTVAIPRVHTPLTSRLTPLLPHVIELTTQVILMGYDKLLPSLLGPVPRNMKLSFRDNFDSLVHLAARAGHPLILNILMKHGFNCHLINGGRELFIESDRRGWTTVDNKGSYPLFDAAENGNAECLSLLLRHSMDTDSTPDKRQHRARLGHQTPMSGDTALHIAAAKGHTECVILLLGTESPLESQNDLRLTPFQYAMKNGHEECAALISDFTAAKRIPRPA